MSRRRGQGWHQESDRHSDAAHRGWDGRRKGDSGPAGHSGKPDPRLLDPMTKKEYDDQWDWIDAGHCPFEICMGCGEEKVLNDDRLCRNCHRKSPRGGQEWRPAYFKGEPVNPKIVCPYCANTGYDPEGLGPCPDCGKRVNKYGAPYTPISSKDWSDEAETEFDKDIHSRLQSHIDDEIEYFREENGRDPTQEEIDMILEDHRADEIKALLESGEYPITMIVTDEKTGKEFNRLYFKTEGEAGNYHDIQTEYGFDPRSSNLSVEILDERESEKVQAPVIPKDWDSDEEQERALYNAMDSLDDGGKIRLLRVHYFPQTEQITSVEIKEYDDADDYEDDVNHDLFSDPTKDIILTPETEEAAKVKYQPNARVE